MIDLFLTVAIVINCAIMGHIFGSIIGQLLAKLVACAAGFEIKFVNHNTGVTHTEHFRWKEAWTALGDLERIRRYHRDNQAPGR